MPSTKTGTDEGSPCSPEAIEQALVEYRGDPLETASIDACFVIIDLPALQGIATPQVLERPSIVSNVFQGLRQSKVRHSSDLSRRQIIPSGQCFERCQIGIARTETS